MYRASSWQDTESSEAHASNSGPEWSWAGFLQRLRALPCSDRSLGSVLTSLNRSPYPERRAHS